MTRKTPLFGIGVDIEQIDRFKKFRYHTQDAFLRRVYTKKELQYCFSKKNSAECLAARFAGKEAVRKSLNGITKRLPAFADIEIFSTASGAPRVVLRQKASVLIQISLSHSGGYAAAFALTYKI